MPEGHIIHRLAAAYLDAFEGSATRSSSPQGRFAEEAREIDGLSLRSADAFGKHLLLGFGEPNEGAPGRFVHVHLGMAGKTSFVEAPWGERPVVGAVRWRLENEAVVADLRGPAACQLFELADVVALRSRLGEDPLRDDADPARVAALVTKSRRSIAELLMDQKVYAGVGNIFRAEVLYRHRLDPFMQGAQLRPAEVEAVWSDLVMLMRTAVVAGRIDTVAPEHSPEAMGRAPRVDRHGGEVYVYRRDGQPCLVCGTPIRTKVVAARNLFWCPRCQPRTRRRAR